MAKRAAKAGEFADLSPTPYPLAKLKPDPRNARVHPAEQIEQLAASMKEFGVRAPILARSDDTIVFGHGRQLAALKIGLALYPVIRVPDDWTDEKCRAYMIADNQHALNAEWDFDVLRAEMAALELAPFDLAALGFSVDSLAELMAAPGKALSDPEEAPEPPAVPVIKRGEVWLLGKHRLLCGDSTDISTVEQVLAGKKAQATLTDPPYGVGLSYGEFSDTQENVSELARKWLPIARQKSGVVCFSSGVTRQWLYPEPSWVLCWFYGGGQLSGPWGFSCWQPFLCYGADPMLKVGRGRHPDAIDMNTPANAKDINHPCPKPIQLWRWMLLRVSTKAGDRILDPFAGSGTTLIACEMEGRTCIAIEIEPAYCDVIIQRFAAVFGVDATRETDGMSYAALAGLQIGGKTAA